VDSLNLVSFMQRGAHVDLELQDPYGPYLYGEMTGGGAGGAGHAFLYGIENLNADAFNDSLRGSGSANVLNGGGGADTLEGAGGNDTLIGGAGDDTFAIAHAGGPANADAGSDLAAGR